MADDQFKAVETSILQKFELLTGSSFQHSIYEVPEYIRNVNKECYEPVLVSIGPVYYKNPALKQFQKIKLAHLQFFIGFINEHDYGLKEFFNFMKGLEEKVRASYQHKIELSSNEFIEMVMVDAAFIISLFMYSPPFNKYDSRVAGEIVRCSNELERDLFLIENQLPFFVLNDLFNQVFGTAYPQVSFRDLCLTFIEKEASSTIRTKVNEESNIEHLVDFLRICYLPSDLRRLNLIPAKIVFNKCHLSAKGLRKAGVKFAASKSENLLDISFSKGVLTIPKFHFHDDTEAIYRNILFFEQSHFSCNSYFVDYMVFLDDLIDTPEDVQILVRKHIISNCLGSDEELATIINSMVKNLKHTSSSYYYSNVCQELNAHASKKWNRWKATLRFDYINHPWAITSVVYLVILLVLTVLQVYTGFKQLK